MSQALLGHPLGREKGFPKVTPLSFPLLPSHSKIIFTIQGDLQTLMGPQALGALHWVTLTWVLLSTEHHVTTPPEGCKLFVGPVCPPHSFATFSCSAVHSGPFRGPQSPATKSYRPAGHVLVVLVLAASVKSCLSVRISPEPHFILLQGI